MIGAKFTITGRNHYQVNVKSGQKVFFKREPENTYDPNAVVCTYKKEVIGHLKKEVAALLSPFMNYDTCIFGTLTQSAHGSYNTSMIVENIIESPKFAVLKQWELLS